MDGQPLWVLCDYFQRYVPGFTGDSRWVRQSDAEAAVAAERASIRRALLAEFGANRRIVNVLGKKRVLAVVLDEICPR